MRSLTVAGLVISLVALLTVSTTWAASDLGFVVVANRSARVSTISKDRLSDVFLGKVKEWENGVRVALINQLPSSFVRGEFARFVHDRKVAAVKSYWQHMLFSGRGVPPREVADDSEVVRFVASNAGGIGYVSPSADFSGVTVVAVSGL